MTNKEQALILKNGGKNWQKWGLGRLNILVALFMISILLSACNVSYTTIPSMSVEATVSPTLATVPTVTLIPTVTPVPSPTSMPSDPPGTIALDFIALLCNADWMNGAQHLAACPAVNADQSGGYAATSDALSDQFPNTPVLLMVPNANALFLRYPAFQVGAHDRFHTTLLCGTSASCDVQFALEYYDAQGKYHEFMKWDYKTGAPPIVVDLDLSALAGQSVDLVLTLRLFHAIESPQHDNGLWVAPHIYRPLP